MATTAHPPHADDALAAQMAARVDASRRDAAVLAPLRSEAAARALGMEVPARAVATVEDDEPEVIPDPVPDVFAEAVPEVDVDAVLPHEVDEDAPASSPGPWPMPVPEESAAPPEAKYAPPAGVILPSGGPARVTTGVFAAAKAQHPKGDRPVMELRPTVLATDIDRVGDQLVVMRDRLELRDRHGGLRRTVALADINDVQIQRRLTSAVLLVTTRTSTDMIIKGLRPEAAESARETIMTLRPLEDPFPNQFDDRSLMRSIVELHRAGILDDAELAAKTAMVDRLAGRSGRP